METFHSRLRSSILRSFKGSIGNIVFGMEDGTVSIFGLVAGVSITAQTGKSVLVAGAAGAVAAAVSMMAGVFLDLQSENDRERVQYRRHMLAIQTDLASEVAAMMERLKMTGLQPHTLEAIERDLISQPDTLLRLERSASAPTESTNQRPIANALWMLVSDLFAGLTPVLAFAVLPLEEARPVSLAMTLALLVLLGYGRARIGERPLIPTILTTVLIAGCAAAAGVTMGFWIDQLS
jgi:VIT1/CCC1 family predicted Fe2+/Mn2+ transporter